VADTVAPICADAAAAAARRSMLVDQNMEGIVVSPSCFPDLAHYAARRYFVLSIIVPAKIIA
jgi:hypothetical protein